MSRKHDKGFIELIKNNVKLDEDTGQISLDGLYANLAVNVGWRGRIIVVPYAHIVWLLKHGRWPVEGFVLDHIDNNPLNNRPENLQEITQDENQRKRRGRLVYRSYGKGKYGYGISVHNDKRDGRFYVTRQLSRGHGKGDLRSIKRGLGGFDTLKEAEAKVTNVIASIVEFGPAWMPEQG